jgi:hypothetical protein
MISLLDLFYVADRGKDEESAVSVRGLFIDSFYWQRVRYTPAELMSGVIWSSQIFLSAKLRDANDMNFFAVHEGAIVNHE